MSLRLSSGMLFQYETWAFAFHPANIRTPNDYIVGSWPLKVTLQCLIPFKELSLLAYLGSWSTIAGLLITGRRERSSLRCLCRFNISLFMSHGGPILWDSFAETRLTLRDIKLNERCAALESTSISFQPISGSNP